MKMLKINNYGEVCVKDYDIDTLVYLVINNDGWTQGRAVWTIVCHENEGFSLSYDDGDDSEDGMVGNMYFTNLNSLIHELGSILSAYGYE
jgi:hypothetical protein